MTLLEFVTVTTAVLGACLGVINTVWALNRDRVRLRVEAVWLREARRTATGGLRLITTTHAQAFGDDGAGRLGIKVTNLSAMEVTIDGLGLTPSGFIDRAFRHRLIRYHLDGESLGDEKIPQKLGPRQSVTFWSSEEGTRLWNLVARSKRLYASTTCGVDVFADTKLFQRLRQHARGL